MKYFSLIIILCMVIFCFELNAQDLNPGDGVRLTFYNITDEISGDYYVQQGGYIQLPYIGLVKVLGLDFNLIKSEIESKYDSLYREPELTVQPLFKINVLGEVSKPGIYYVTGIEKLSDLIALAGGETSDANLDNIYLIRQEKEIEIDAEKIMKEGDNLEDIGLKSGDRIYVPRKWWVGARNAGIIISAGALLVTIISLVIR